MISNGPSRLGANFLLSCRSLRCFDSSQTLSPSLNGLNPRVILSIIFCCANSCAALASSLAFCNSNNRSFVAGVFVTGNAVGIERGLYPIYRNNEDSLWFVCGFMLYENSNVGRCDFHVSGWFPQNIDR